MLHCEADTLALVALGAPLADDERRHLQQCARCQSELDQNRAVVATGRQVSHDDTPSEPPASVWSAVAEELGLGPEVSPFVPDPDEQAEHAQVIELAQFEKRRRAYRTRTVLVGAAAAFIGVVAGAVGATSLPDQAAGNVVAESQLDVVPISAGGTDIAADASGTALIIDRDGQDFAEIDARALPEIDGYYEVWLIRSDLSGMISLGALTAGSQGRFTIPAGTDLREFTILDISAEPLNGDPVHSKESVLRGTLDV